MTNAKINLLGNVKYDPTLRQVGANDVLNFTVVVNTSQKEEGGFNSNQYDCSLWNQKARRYYEKLKKGTMVILWGDLEVVERVNSEGNKVTKLRVEVDDVRPFLGLRNAERKADDTVNATPNNPSSDIKEPEEDLTE